MARTKNNGNEFHGPHDFHAVAIQALIDEENEMGSDYDDTPVQYAQPNNQDVLLEAAAFVSR